jgi:hypothetical protein
LRSNYCTFWRSGFGLLKPGSIFRFGPLVNTTATEREENKVQYVALFFVSNIVVASRGVGGENLYSELLLFI